MTGRCARGAFGIVAAALVLACGGGEQAAAPPPPEVIVATAAVGAVPDRREYAANVRAVNQVEVRARVRGYLAEQRFEDGQIVKEGQLLFRIDPREYEIALAEANGQLARARANADRAQRDYARAQELHAQKVVSVSVLDQRRAERDAAAAEVQAASAAARDAELRLSYTEVTAPITGRIGRALVDTGNLVGESGQDTVLAEIVQVDPVHVYFAPTERDRLDVLRGAEEGRIPEERVGTIPIEIRLGDGTRYPHAGVIDYVDPTVEATRGTVAVRALVPNPEGALKPGQFVRATAIFPDRTNAVLVPQRAVLQEQAGSSVLVVKPDDVVESRTVEIGALHDGMQEIRTGLEAGERVVADGVQKARPGSKVVPRPLEPEVAAEPDAGATPPPPSR